MTGLRSIPAPYRSLVLATVLIAVASAAPAAERVLQESEITSLRIGQHVYVDDGTCPAGQIKEITGSRLTAQGVALTRKCLDRRNMR